MKQGSDATLKNCNNPTKGTIASSYLNCFLQLSPSVTNNTIYKAFDGEPPLSSNKYTIIKTTASFAAPNFGSSISHLVWKNGAVQPGERSQVSSFLV